MAMTVLACCSGVPAKSISMVTTGIVFSVRGCTVGLAEGACLCVCICVCAYAHVYVCACMSLRKSWLMSARVCACFLSFSFPANCARALT